MAEQDRLLHSIEDVTATMEGGYSGATSSGEVVAPPEPETAPKVYGPLDMIEPEDFQRALLDRHISKVDSYFGQAFGWENSILQVSADRLHALGAVSLLDVGCGTGNTLRTWAAALRLQADDPSKVTAVGINLHDYSEESRSAHTRRAIVNGDITYVVGNAEEMLTQPEIPAQSADIIVACMSLIHMRRPVQAVMQILRAQRPGGTAFINVPIDLYDSGSPLMELVYRLEDLGYNIEERQGIVPAPPPHKSWSTLFMKIQRPETT